MIPRFAINGYSLVCQDGGRIRHMTSDEAMDTMERFLRHYHAACEAGEAQIADVIARDIAVLGKAYAEAKRWTRAANVRSVG